MSEQEQSSAQTLAQGKENIDGVQVPLTPGQAVCERASDLDNLTRLYFNISQKSNISGRLGKKLFQSLTRPMFNRQIEFNKITQELFLQTSAAIVQAEGRIAALDHTVAEISVKQTLTEQEARTKSGLFFNEPIWVTFKDGEAEWVKTSERILERAFVLQSLARLYETTEIDILDVGAAESMLSYELASLGYNVTGTDVRPIALSHPNLKFVKGDICEPVFPTASFDCAIALSTLEHIGLGWYGDGTGDSLDRRAVEQIYSLLKPHGHFILTVPYGKIALTPVHRIYDSVALHALIQDFQVDCIMYGIRLDNYTFVTTSEESQAAVKEHDPESYLPGAVAMLVCTKL